MIIHESNLGTIEFNIIKIKHREINCLKFVIKQLSNTENKKALYSDILKFYKYAYDNNIIFIQIYDFTNSETSLNDINFGRVYGDFLRTNAEKYLLKCCIGTSIIVISEIVKNIINTILYFYSNVKPTKVYNSYDDAYSWLLSLSK